MSLGSRRWRGLAAATSFALGLAMLLSGCGSTGVAGSGQTTALSTSASARPSVTPTLSESAVQAIVAARSNAFVKAARRFHACDHAAEDTYNASPCIAKVAAETVAVRAILGDLRSVQVPARYATTVRDLEALSGAGSVVARKCAKDNNQVCDQALARFRADEQSVVWDLEVTL